MPTVVAVVAPLQKQGEATLFRGSEARFDAVLLCCCIHDCELDDTHCKGAGADAGGEGGGGV